LSLQPLGYYLAPQSVLANTDAPIPAEAGENDSANRDDIAPKLGAMRFLKRLTQKTPESLADAHNEGNKRKDTDDKSGAWSLRSDKSWGIGLQKSQSGVLFLGLALYFWI
jgi:hypothetical protein